LHNKLAQILREEEIKWYQRERDPLTWGEGTAAWPPRVTGPACSDPTAPCSTSEEPPPYQRAKSNEPLQGDSNTKYFQLVAGGKHGKAIIFQLKDGVHTIQGEEALKKHITSYYNVLFEPPDPSEVELDENQVLDIPQVSDLENSFLTS
jgi:hypothetical protein